jgi:uncharacterized protein (TIGR01777 family)
MITGGTGFVGSVLLPRLGRDGHHCVVLTRNPGAMKVSLPSVETEQWDGINEGPWANRIENTDAVINLAGESIAGGRWTRRRKQTLIESRILPTRAIVSAIRRAARKPAVLINASAVGYYGPVEEGDVPESHPAGSDFLARLCASWEEEARAAEQYGVRVAMLRFGVILQRGGGALKRLTLPFRLFAGGWLGSGLQWFPWVHGDDVAGIVEFTLGDRTISGAVNVAAPQPVTAKEFSQELGRVMRRPCWAPVPGFILRLVLGELAGMLLTGQRVVPQKLTGAGYAFAHPTLSRSLEAILCYPPA